MAEGKMSPAFEAVRRERIGALASGLGIHIPPEDQSQNLGAISLFLSVIKGHINSSS